MGLDTWSAGGVRGHVALRHSHEPMHDFDGGGFIY